MNVSEITFYSCKLGVETEEDCDKDVEQERGDLGYNDLALGWVGGWEGS